MRPKKPNRGRPMNAYLREEDVQHARQLCAWLMAETGRRVSDSLVIRSALFAALGGYRKFIGTSH